MINNIEQRLYNFLVFESPMVFNTVVQFPIRGDAANNYMFYSVLTSRYLQRLSGSRRVWKNYCLIVNGNSFCILGHLCEVL